MKPDYSVFPVKSVGVFDNFSDFHDDVGTVTIDICCSKKFFNITSLHIFKFTITHSYLL